MQTAYIVTGVMKGPRHIELDESVPEVFSRIKIIVEPISEITQQNSFFLGLEKIRDLQKKRNFQPTSRKETDRQIENLRNSWD